ncbi:MAG: hypothetical protein PF487_01145 [Bacteroidales bacterium]|nr:hypothetical protein [Bacteroidales bacterium]
MRTEDSFCNDLFTPNTGDSVPDEFKEFTIDNKEHSEKMKEIISNDIVNHLTQCPDDYKNEQGEYEYQPDVYDFAYVVDSYIEQLYEDTHCTKTVLVCTNCNSDNVQTKMWVKANTKEVLDSAGDDSDEDSWCEDCQGHHDLETKTMIPRKKVIGFQVEDANGTHIMHPDMDASFCVYNLSQAIEMIKSDNNDYWKLLTIWTDDIENPTMMFEGNVR